MPATARDGAEAAPAKPPAATAPILFAAPIANATQTVRWKEKMSFFSASTFEVQCSQFLPLKIPRTVLIFGTSVRVTKGYTNIMSAFVGVLLAE
jgi:hypothetical protein